MFENVCTAVSVKATIFQTLTWDLYDPRLLRVGLASVALFLDYLLLLLNP